MSDGSSTPSSAYGDALRSQVDSLDALRSIYRAPGKTVLDKVINRIDGTAATFIAMSPLVVLATGDDTRSDASPRGGEPGFVKVIGPNQLAFGDLVGNNRLDSFANLVSNPMIGMLFVVPGLTETLRIRGTAALVRDAELAARCAIGERVPKTVVVVNIEECYLHCGAAFKRAGVWDPTTWPGADERPSPGAILAAHAQLDVSADVIEADLDTYYKDYMWEVGGIDGES